MRENRLSLLIGKELARKLKLYITAIHEQSELLL